MRTELNDALAPGLRARAGASREAQSRERDRGLAAAAALGSPIPVLDKCLERFKRPSFPRRRESRLSF